ncbi:MAG: OmpA family protein [Planctomycetes bacterium]|nr:OmpA family protein [Planctomycetota bacterium]
MIKPRRPFRPGDDAAPIWMISFSDLQAQLMVFFALLLSFSTLDPAKVAQVGASFTGSTGRENPPPRDDFIVWWVMSKQISTPTGKSVTKEQWGPEGREFIAERTREGIRISLERAITFEEGSAEIRADQLDAIQGFLRFIRGSLNKLDVRGFTGPNENPPDDDHWRLSAARARAVADLLIAGKGEAGIDPARIRVTGMGKNDPVVDVIEVRDTFQWQRNRRVEILVLEEKVKVR